MAKKFADVWEDVEEALEDAKGIAFEGCHKIYILLDDKQMEEMKSYGYGEDGTFLVPSTAHTKAELLTIVKDWYEKSCGLKFVQSVASVEEDDDENDGFNSIIPQGYQDEFCVTCGDFGTDFDGYCDECREDWEDENNYDNEDED